MDKLLEYLERLVKILRPKAYNSIAKAVVWLGLALIAESQIKFFQAIAISIYEYIFGYSEILRLFVSGDASSWLGVGLVLVGLMYHCLMTIGLASVEVRRAQFPKEPQISISLLDADCNECPPGLMPLRGCIAIVPDNEDIPDYKVDVNIPRFGSLIESLSKAKYNSDFYRERANLLRVWGGAELISFRLHNGSSFMATGVLVQLTIPKEIGVSADNTNVEGPILPDRENYGPFRTSALQIAPVTAVDYDVHQEHDNEFYRFSWSVGDVQAGTDAASETSIFLRSDHDLMIELSIFCDQYSSPKRTIFKVNRGGAPFRVSLSDLMSKNEEFLGTVSHCVMDGYINRFGERLRREYERNTSHLVP